MILFHNSQDIRYRAPFGAVETETIVKLRLDISAEGKPNTVFVRTWTNEKEEYLPMSLTRCSDGNYVYETEVQMPQNPSLFWYCFVAERNGKKLWYVNNSQRLGGIGECSDEGNGPSYQITVYDREYKTPKWFCGRIMYQIFPDRFYGYLQNREIHKKRGEYIIHYDKGEGPSNNLHPYENGPAYNDFYGGNLRGITEKLPYIKSLGVGVIYLNPIFDAYSNHKYDTANYKEIDPMFGTEEDFKELCQKAKELDIAIILDGVFSHTGADSIYFNKYKSYGDGGAFNDCNSPYRSWYNIGSDGSYESWWGCSNLPNVNELEPSYLDYILRDKNSVIKKWVSLGASGWRLDVADELPDEFIKILRTELKRENPEAVIIGEVWEDASNKIAYGKQREYLFGGELDSVMNYVFRDSVIAFLLGRQSADDFAMRYMSIMENYPVFVTYSLMNLIGTHDTPRIKSVMGGVRDDCMDEKLSSGLEDLATYRLMCAAFMQMTFPGVPSIYYGDEAGMQGGKDPYNRAPYPWHSVDMELIETYRLLGKMRNENNILKTGYFKVLYSEGDVLVYARFCKDGRDIFGVEADGLAICAVNRGFEEKSVIVDLSEFGMGEEESQEKIEIAPVGTKIIFK